MTLPTVDMSSSTLADDRHVFVAGASGRGKTGALILLARAKLKDPRFGLHCIDPEGDITPSLLEFIANPANSVSWRAVHHLRPASTSHGFGIALLQVPVRTPQACHEAAIRTRTIFEQVLNFGLGEYGPRLSKLFHLGCYGLSLTGRPLVALPELFTLGAAHLRSVIGEAFPFQFMSEEWRALDVLGARQFTDYCDAIGSRLLPVFGNPSLRRIYGQESGVDITQMLNRREVALLDLSGLEHKDRMLVGRSYFSVLYHAALERPPGQSAPACCIIDEVADFMTPDVARGFDRLRKRKIQLCVAAQRLGQLQDAETADCSVLNAILTNAQAKVIFGGLAPDDAELMARVLFHGFVDHAEYKPGTERPTPVANERVLLKTRSRTQHHAEHTGHAITDMRSQGRMSAATHASMSAWGSSFGDATSASFSGTPTAMPFTGPIPVSQQLGRSQQRSGTASGGRSAARSVAQHTQQGRATTTTRASADASSICAGETEAFITRYENLPTQLYSLPEQWERLIGELINLPRREVFVKIEDQRPYRARTATLTPAFNSATFKAEMLPRFQLILERSRYLAPAAQIDAEIAARLAGITQPPATPEPDFTTPEAMPPIDRPQEFARAFWRRRATKQSLPPPEPPPDTADTTDTPFRVIKGGKDDDGDNP